MNFSGFMEFKTGAWIYVLWGALSNLNDIDKHIEIIMC